MGRGHRTDPPPPRPLWAGSLWLVPWTRCAGLDLLLSRCLGSRHRAVAGKGMAVPLLQIQKGQA